MAEIRIERKGRGLGWLWLLLALIIVAVLAWYFLYPGRTSTAPASAPPTTGSSDGAAPLMYRVAALSRSFGGIQRTALPGGGHGEQG